MSGKKTDEAQRVSVVCMPIDGPSIEGEGLAVDGNGRTIYTRQELYRQTRLSREPIPICPTTMANTYRFICNELNRMNLTERKRHVSIVGSGEEFRFYLNDGEVGYYSILHYNQDQVEGLAYAQSWACIEMCEAVDIEMKAMVKERTGDYFLIEEEEE